jgi:Kef-type K+ transport system membrane component KefB
MIDVDSGSFLAVVVAGALAAFLAGLVSTRMPLPVVVVEILLGILIGPDLLGLADPDAFLNFFSNLGLGMLFFFAGYEIDFERIRGSPLRLAILGWLLSLVLAYSLGGLLTLTGLVLSLLFTGSALATTAIGTLIPVLSDAGELRTRFGTYLLAAGAAGEFGPLAVLAALMAVRGVGRGWALLDRTLETSGQLAIRILVVMVFALGALADSLGLDLLLGGFVAGVIARIALQGREVAVLESKLVAVGYGFLIPFFFVVSGVNFDLSALTNEPKRLLELPLFLALFLIVRGTPALLLYRGVFGLRDRAALAIFSATGLPLIVAITTIAVEEGHMRSATAAALVGAGILSTAILPVVGLRLRAGTPKEDEPHQVPGEGAAVASA